MMLGQDLIIECPHCGALARHIRLMSGNNIGLRLWTDGKRYAPMMPLPPDVVLCARCGNAYWRRDARVVGRLDPRTEAAPGEVMPHAAVPAAFEPDASEYYTALAFGLAGTPTQERDLRMLAWWRHNDAFRDETNAKPSPEPVLSLEGQHNLRLLVDLLNDADVSDRLKKAEIWRELGAFARACQVLDSLTGSDYGEVVRQLRAHCEARDSRVREFCLDYC